MSIHGKAETKSKAETKTAGLCPECNSDALNYGDYDRTDDEIGYLFSCAVCNAEGVEWHSLVFKEFDITNKGEL